MGLHITSQHRSSSMARRRDGVGWDMCWVEVEEATYGGAMVRRVRIGIETL
jgi:hypothetical protein